MRRDHPVPCPDRHDALAELALGTLAGQERSDVLAHVARCHACALELSELSRITDDLLQLAPAASPPVGFELRVVERVLACSTSAPTGRPRRRKRHRLASWRPAAVAALLAAVVGTGAGLLAASTTAGKAPPAASRPVTLSASLARHGRVFGHVRVSSGRTPWLFVTVDDLTGPGSRTVICEVTLVDGTTAKLGRFRLSQGYGSWGVPLAAPADSLRRALLVGTDGSVLASARI